MNIAMKIAVGGAFAALIASGIYDEAMYGTAPQSFQQLSIRGDSLEAVKLDPHASLNSEGAATALAPAEVAGG